MSGAPVCPVHQLADHGIVFAIRIVPTGGMIGRARDIVNKAQPMVEFYDTRYPHTDCGQFVSSYYLSTILDGDQHFPVDELRGLQLDGGVPDWHISAAGMREVRKQLALWRTGQALGLEPGAPKPAAPAKPVTHAELARVALIHGGRDAHMVALACIRDGGNIAEALRVLESKFAKRRGG